MAKKQQGYVAQKRDNDAGHIYFYNDVEHCEGLIKYHRRKLVKATLVIGDERVFTESEVRAMLQRASTSMTFPNGSVLADHAERSLGIVMDPA